MSITVTVLYPNTPGSKFDMDYYLDKHAGVVHQHWDSHGLVVMKVLKGIATPDPATPPPYRVVCLLEFESLDDFEAAVKAAGKEVMGDIANFTDAPPQIQINDNVA